MVSPAVSRVALKRIAGGNISQGGYAHITAPSLRVWSIHASRTSPRQGELRSKGLELSRTVRTGPERDKVGKQAASLRGCRSMPRQSGRKPRLSCKLTLGRGRIGSPVDPKLSGQGFLGNLMGDGAIARTAFSPPVVVTKSRKMIE